MAVASSATLVCPRPAIEKATGTRLVLAGKSRPLTIDLPEAAEGPLVEGLALLRARSGRLGFALATGDAGLASIRLSRCDDQTLAGWLKDHGVAQKLEAGRGRQAYHLAVKSSSNGTPVVNIQATHDWGLYYAMVTLCQLLDVDDAGEMVIPSLEILDFPEIAHRLAKLSASSTPADVARFARLLPPYKISLIGLQFHGAFTNTSKQPGPEFTTNIKTLCRKFRRDGTLESIVYFCPFRGTKDKETGVIEGAYDFTRAADKAAYAEYLAWIMEQGAHGIEVDYNDWPGSPEVPISDVLNLACKTVKERYPDAYLLYCPPGRGTESYIGLPTPGMTQTMSRVPPVIWPLWTGLYTLIREPLTVENVNAYTLRAGRRPFLWLNRVGLNAKESFSRQVPGVPDRRVFAGDRLPRELNRLFEGVHFNTSLIPGINNPTLATQTSDAPPVFPAEELIYLATAADFVWNPSGWEPAESYRRAVHFVEVMGPLQQTGALSGTGGR